MKHRLPFVLFVFLFVGLLLQTAAAQAISGTVTNGTSGKPAAGAEVTLVSPMEGMAELDTTKTDAQGHYSLKGGQAQGPRLVRATLAGVNYFQMAPPGTTSVDLQVYDAAKKVEGIEGTANIVRIEAQDSELRVIHLLAVNNAAKPPRTLNGDATLEVALPEGAKVDGADAQGPNGQPITVSLKALPKQHYAFNYPLKPGETRFQIAYHLPYKGDAVIAMPVLSSWRHVVVMLPQGITWKPQAASSFQPMTADSGGNVQVATDVKPGEIKFGFSGTGSFPAEPVEQAQAGQGGRGGQDAAAARPGGGLGPPIDAPDALAKYRWLILGMLAVVLAGTAYVTSGRRAAALAAADEAMAPPPAAMLAPAKAPAPQTAPNAATAGSGNALLDAMKEELFQLELERQRGQISAEEYAKNKAALDQTLQRALSRAKQS